MTTECTYYVTLLDRVQAIGNIRNDKDKIVVHNGDICLVVEIPDNRDRCKVYAFRDKKHYWVDIKDFDLL